MSSISPSFQFSHRGAVLVLVLEGGAFEVQMKSPLTPGNPTMPPAHCTLDDDDDDEDSDDDDDDDWVFSRLSLPFR